MRNSSSFHLEGSDVHARRIQFLEKVPKKILCQMNAKSVLNGMSEKWYESRQMVLKKGNCLENAIRKVRKVIKLFVYPLLRFVFKIVKI